MSNATTQTLGFTLTELMIVIAIIAVLVSVFIIIASPFRMSSRDTQRVNDIGQIQGALNMYYAKYNQYPTALSTGQTFAVNSLIYLSTVPSNPKPRTDNGCPDQDYQYTQTGSGLSYTLTFCLGKAFGDVQAGKNMGIPEGIVSNP